MFIQVNERNLCNYSKDYMKNRGNPACLFFTLEENEISAIVRNLGRSNKENIEDEVLQIVEYVKNNCDDFCLFEFTLRE